MQNPTRYGAGWRPGCHRAKAFLRENEVNFQYIDMDAMPGAAGEVTRLNNGKRIIINGGAPAAGKWIRQKGQVECPPIRQRRISNF